MLVNKLVSSNPIGKPALAPTFYMISFTAFLATWQSQSLPVPWPSTHLEQTTLAVFSIVKKTRLSTTLYLPGNLTALLLPETALATWICIPFPIYVNHIQPLPSSTHWFFLENALNKYGNKSAPPQHKTNLLNCTQACSLTVSSAATLTAGILCMSRCNFRPFFPPLRLLLVVLCYLFPTANIQTDSRFDFDYIRYIYSLLLIYYIISF